MSALLKGSKLKAFSLFIFFFTILSCHSCYGWDPLDARGNVTIQWDIMDESSSTYNADVTIYNYQQYRHIEWPPGWTLSWEWQDHGVIWNMQGAEAKEQGVCNKSLGSPPPHCCLKRPVIIDLQPGAILNKQAANCCRGGVLTSMAQDSTKYLSHFQMSYGFGASSSTDTKKKLPSNFTFGTPGYTCGEFEQVDHSTRIPEDGGRRWRQALRTYRVICIYSQFRASPAPTCCVSLSAFYSKTITLCPKCSCGCQDHPGSSCLKKGRTPPALPKSKDPDYAPPPLVNCTGHMCPIHIHWHIKQNYKGYWRVKMTIMNLNLRKNYTSWNLAIEHPNLDKLVESFSFNYKPLTDDRPINDTGLFWGIQHYNDVLLHSGPNGNVQTEMLLKKEPATFTFEAGWAFPRRVYFNGENCVMPLPTDFPRLPRRLIG